MNLPIRNTIGSFPSYLWLSEATIIDGVITAALKRDLKISVFDGEEWAVKQSTNPAEIQREVAATDMTAFLFCDANTGDLVGSMLFVHGNQADVISDFSDNEMMGRLWCDVEHLCDWDRYQ